MSLADPGVSVADRGVSPVRTSSTTRAAVRPRQPPPPLAMPPPATRRAAASTTSRSSGQTTSTAGQTTSTARRSVKTNKRQRGTNAKSSRNVLCIVYSNYKLQCRLYLKYNLGQDFRLSDKSFETLLLLKAIADSGPKGNETVCVS